MITIVIVDSGVNLNHKIFKDKFISSIEFSDGKIAKCGTDDYGHGTAIAGIISRCDNVKITMIKIKDIEKGIQEDTLISVLNYINMMNNVDIVNLSLGLNVCEDYNSLYNACKVLSDKGVMIVSAFDNTGSISIPYDIGNIVQYSIPQYNFLLGTQPDVVILCVNPFDEIYYIKRTISFIESSVDCKVISLVVFPMDLKDNWTGIYGFKETLSEEKYSRIKEILSNEFNIPIYKLGVENDMNELVAQIINYFAED